MKRKKPTLSEPADDRPILTCNSMSISSTIEDLTNEEQAPSVSRSGRLGHQPLNIYETDPLGDHRWPNFIAEHRSASMYHSLPWLTALRETYGYAPRVISTSHPSEPLTNAMLLSLVRSPWTGTRMVSVPFADHCAILASSPPEIESMLLYLKRLVDRGTLRYAEIRPTATYLLGAYGYKEVVSYYFHRVHLEGSASTIFKRFHKGCIQRRITRAERERLSYEEGRSEDILSKFYRLMVISRKRRGLPPQPLSWFRSLISSFGNQLKIRVASHADMPVAGIMTVCFGNRVTYKYGCADFRYNRFGAMPWLIWKAIEDAKEAGFEEFDLGRSDIKNVGLVAFKSRWGAVSSVGSYWRYPHNASSTLKESRLRFASKVFSATPDSLLILAGGLLYRHIG